MVGLGLPPPGYLVPSLLIGACLGRSLHTALPTAAHVELHGGVYAMVGASAVLAGVSRCLGLNISNLSRFSSICAYVVLTCFRGFFDCKVLSGAFLFFWDTNALVLKVFVCLLKRWVPKSPGIHISLVVIMHLGRASGLPCCLDMFR